MNRNGSDGWARVTASSRLRPAAVPASAPVSEPVLSESPPVRTGLEPAHGPYLGGAADESRHRISFSVLNGSMRNLRVDGLAMARHVAVRDGRVETRHLGFELTAVWVDERHIEGQVKMRGRWGRGQTFRFQARHRYRDVLGGRA